jgi:hypothetical protein
LKLLHLSGLVYSNLNGSWGRAKFQGWLEKKMGYLGCGPLACRVWLGFAFSGVGAVFLGVGFVFLGVNVVERNASLDGNLILKF